MTERDLQQIESKLGIALPREYRKLMVLRQADLKELGYTHDLSAIYPLASQVIAENLRSRKRSDPLGKAHPGWWKSYVLIGTNGAGEFFALGLGREKTVWILGEEHGSSAGKVHKSLTAWVDEDLQTLRSPPPRPSSFDKRRPFNERFDVFLWEDKCVIKPFQADCPLTLEKLRKHGIRIAGLRMAVRVVVAALAGLNPAAVKLRDPPQEVDEEGNLAIVFEPPTPRDPRVIAATASLFRGNVKLWIEVQKGTPGMPAVDTCPVNWDALKRGFAQLFQTLIPSVGTVRWKTTKAEGWWEFRMKYTLHR